MKNIVWLIALTVFSLGLIPAAADADLLCDEPNLFALTFDLPATTINLDGIAPYGQVTAYLQLINPETECMAGFELELIVPDDVQVLSYEFPGNSVNVGSETTFIVGFSYPHPVEDNRALLCTLSLLYMDTLGGQQDFYLSPSTPASIDGSMAFLGCTGNIVAADPISMNYDLPVARINGYEPLVYCQDEGINGLTVQISSQGDDDNLAGTSTWATDGFDAGLDLIDPDPNPVVFFSHPEWNHPEGESFHQDIMAEFDPYATTRSWSFAINSTIPEGVDPPYTVEVNFLPSFADDTDIFLTVVDQATGQHSLLEEPFVLSYPISSNELRTFEMVIGNEAILPPIPDLDILVSVNCNGLSDLNNHAAAAYWATDGYDPDIDLPEPGPPPSNYLTASFTQAAWPYGPRFRTMVHGGFSTEAELKSWPLRLETDQIGTVEMNFLPDFDEAAGTQLRIKDQLTGQVYDLFPDLTFSYENSSPSVRDFLIIVGNQGPPPLAPAERWILPGWAMIGMPLIPDPAHPSLMENILAQATGAAYIYHYLGEDGYELEDNYEDAVYGRGYWLAVNQSLHWSMTGEMALEPVNIPLIPGWNMVGYPLWFAGALDNVQVEHLNKTYTWQQAVNDGLVVGSVIGFDTYNDEYEVMENLYTWSGYWFGALEMGVSLVFDWENFLTIPDRISNPDRTEHPPESMWSTNVRASDSGGNSHEVSFGVHPEASAGFDPFLDVPLIPAGPNSIGHMGLLRPEWDLPMGNRASRDLVAPEDELMAWDAEIVVAESGSVTLQWDRLNWPDGLDLQIYLPQSNRVVVHSMRSQNSVRLPAPQGYLVVQFRTPQLSGVDDIPAAAYGLSIHPNPFNPQTTISFALATEGEAEVRIYSVRGEMVSVLQSGAIVAGRHEVTWAGRDRSGREVPSGSYFARLYVDGKAVGSVAKMSLVR